MNEERPPSGFPINFIGCGAFIVALGVSAGVRFLIPDHEMIKPSSPMSPVESAAGGVYAITLIVWLYFYFRESNSPWLTGFGALWTPLVLLPLGIEYARSRHMALLPLIALIASLSVLVLGHWIWQLRSSGRRLDTQAREEA